MNEAELLLHEAWRSLIEGYTSGELVIIHERDMEKALKDICLKLADGHGNSLTVVNQETHRGRRVDLRIGEDESRILLQLKFYHDSADWKERPAMTNTVESDLKFAKDHEDTYVGIIDVIPTSTRARLPYMLTWQTIEIELDVFDKHYFGVNPRTSPPRERIQQAVLAKGSDI